jgi:hypothetical protein
MLKNMLRCTEDAFLAAACIMMGPLVVPEREAG